MSKAIVLLSGGLDSTTVLAITLDQGYEVTALSFNYGQRHNYEIKCAKTIIDYLNNLNKDINHSIIDLSELGGLLYSSLTTEGFNTPQGHYEDASMNDTIVPNRNAIFLSVLYGWALSISKELNSKVICSLGVHSGDHAIYPDCRIEFYNKIIESFSIGNWGSEKISIYLPCIDFEKSDILKDALSTTAILTLDFDTIFKNTITSYNPDNNGISDGKSGSDIERILAFHKIGKIDPIEYKKSWAEVLEFAKKTEKDVPPFIVPDPF